MKKYFLTASGILSLLAAGAGYNNLDVHISVSGEKVIVFETKTECLKAKKGIINIFKKKELTPDQGFVLEAFNGQSCGIILEEGVPDMVNMMTVTESKVYYSPSDYSKRKDSLYKKSKENPTNMTIFEQRDLIGIVNEEMKRAGKKGYKSISTNDIVIELEKK
jgi:hypothetical protein